MSCGNPHEVDCGEVLGRLWEYLDGELEVADTGRLRTHLEECAPCLDEYALEQAMKALLRRSCACESAPDELRRRIMVQITEVTELRGSLQAGVAQVTQLTSLRYSGPLPTAD